MQGSNSPTIGNSKPDADELLLPRFEKSLQELRGLRTQLHYAADYCEAAYLKDEKKKLVLQNTKEYLCKAVITLIDHLGNVSANLEDLVVDQDEVSEAELRMDCLQNRLLMWKEHARGHDRAEVHWTATFPRCHPHYISKLTQTGKTSNGPMSLRDAGELVVAESMQQVKLIPYEAKRAHLKQVFDGPSIFSRPRTPSFESLTKDSPRRSWHGSFQLADDRRKKTVKGSSFIPFLRKSKRLT